MAFNPATMNPASIVLDKSESFDNESIFEIILAFLLFSFLIYKIIIKTQKKI